MKIIVTGASGMIGIAIIEEALSHGFIVAAVVRNDSPHIIRLKALTCNNNLKIVECAINNYQSLNFSDNYDAFIHLAWKNTDSSSRDDVFTHTENIKYTLDAVNAAHRAKCNVFISTGSQAEYGCVTEKLSGNTVCNPESGYGIAKYAAGKMAQLYTSQLGIRYCHTRILSTYGEGMSEGALIIYLVKTLLAGKKPLLTKCEQIWDFMYVEDTARAILAIAKKGVDGKVYPLGSGDARPLTEYVEIIRDSIDKSIELKFGEKDYYLHQPMYLCADIKELTHDTGFIPSISFSDGIKKTINWVKSQGD